MFSFGLFPFSNYLRIYPVDPFEPVGQHWIQPPKLNHQHTRWQINECPITLFLQHHRVENYLNHLGTMQTVRETKDNLNEVLSYTEKALLGHHQI